ncbi:hypothetical protein AGMMS50293_18510 [Spirochaetia bacterium]|nr:hypothetical protein AGMMS50293_18510 [Spirochaetia bacterium]
MVIHRNEMKSEVKEKMRGGVSNPSATNDPDKPRNLAKSVTVE